MFRQVSRRIITIGGCALLMAGGYNAFQKRYEPVLTQINSIPLEFQRKFPDYSGKLKLKEASCSSKETPSPLNVSISKHVPGRKEFNRSSHIILFQFVSCPFCCKVRAYLDYHGIPYDIVEVNSVTRKQLQKEWAGPSRKVPILVVHEKEVKKVSGDDEEPPAREYICIHDSSVIISILESIRVCSGFQLHSKPWTSFREELEKMIGFFPEQVNEEGKAEFANRHNLMFESKLHNDVDYAFRKSESFWRKWVDDKFVHVISPNIYRTLGESLLTFKQFSIRGDWEELFPAWERYLVIYLGATVMYFVGKRLKNRHHLHDDVRESLYECAQKWTKAVAKKNKGPFMGGQSPNLGDLALYGAFMSMYGCAAADDVLNQNADFKNWFHSIHRLVPHHSVAVA